MSAVSDQFAFLGGQSCLDFANTVDWHASARPSDRIQTGVDLIAWGHGATLLDDPTRARLTEHARAHPAQSAVELDRARAVRELMYRIFSALARGTHAEAVDVDALSQLCAQAAAHRWLHASGGRYDWRWDATLTLDRVWWPVVMDAAELLTTAPRSRIGECADDRGCGWLFLDTSKAGRRRWCSMQDCGNRAKAQRHRAAAGPSV